MDFRTVISLPKASFELLPQKPMLLMGSCFTDNVGRKLRNAMWNVAVNPCGVLYNPSSIATLISRSLDAEPLVANDLVEREGLFRSWLFDSHFSAADQETALRKMNEALVDTHRYIKDSGCMIITFGTSWIYELAENRSVVSNCHKFPADTFIRRRLSVKEIAETWISLIKRLHAVNSSLKVIFTVSPIRHFKDGAHENSLSKASLMLAIEEIISATSRTDYFPAYELLIDDLRDYRFYAEDMIHPSQTAIDYIWQCFSERYFSEQTILLLKESVRLSQRLNHRPITDNREKAEAFNRETAQRLTAFLDRFPYFVPLTSPDSATLK